MGKYQDSVGISLDLTIVEGSCRWKLSSGNLYTFIRPNQEQIGENATLYRSLAGIEPACGPAIPVQRSNQLS